MFYLILKAKSEVLFELKEHHLSIKSFKALKYYTFKWLTEKHKFEGFLMSIYQQLGQIYKEVGMHRAAMDYFKKQLILSWLFDCMKNENMAYHNIAL